jgi:hypothetical protein
MIDFLIVLAIYLFAFIHGWTSREIYATKRVNELLKEIEAQEEVDPPVKITIEKHNGMFMVYDMGDSSFMAQGGTKKQLEDNLSKRYPGKTFAATPENLIEVGFINDDTK